MATLRAVGWATLPKKLTAKSRPFPVFRSRATAASYAARLGRRVVRVEITMRAAGAC